MIAPWRQEWKHFVGHAPGPRRAIDPPTGACDNACLSRTGGRAAEGTGLLNRRLLLRNDVSDVAEAVFGESQPEHDNNMKSAGGAARIRIVSVEVADVAEWPVPGPMARAT